MKNEWTNELLMAYWLSETQTNKQIVFRVLSNYKYKSKMQTEKNETEQKK